MENKQVLVAKLPDGKLREENYRFNSGPMPIASSSQVVVKTHAFAITAGARAGLQGSASYAGAAASGIVMSGTGIGEVVASKDEAFPEGVMVLGPTGWQSYAALETSAITRIPFDRDPFQYLGPLGINGLTAFFGLFKVGRPAAGDTVMISAAAGSVGHFVGQMAKISGCRVVGVCGDDSKCERLTGELRYDAAVNYRDSNFRERLKSATANGVDVYFDNTGGMVLGSALFRMNVGGRIACCGVVSQYDTDSPEPGPKGIPGLLVNKRIKMQGFLVFDYEKEYESARATICSWLESGEMISITDEVLGIESAPGAFVDLLAGGNVGSRIVRLV